MNIKYPYICFNHYIVHDWLDEARDRGSLMPNCKVDNGVSIICLRLEEWQGRSWISVRETSLCACAYKIWSTAIKTYARTMVLLLSSMHGIPSLVKGLKLIVDISINMQRISA